MDNIFLQNLIKSANHLNQELALNPTENYIEKLLNPLDIDDIVINPTVSNPIQFGYSYNNLDFTFVQHLSETQGKLEAKICAFHNKPKAYLIVGHSSLNISSDSNISITLKQGSPCRLEEIVQLTESLKDDVYNTLDDLGLIPY